MGFDFRALQRLILGQPGFPGLLASTFALGTAFSFAAPFMSKWGTEEVGMSPSQFSLFMTATSISAMVISTVLARYSDTHFSRKQMLLLGSLAGVLGYVGYALVRHPLLLAVIGCSLHAVASICFAQLFAHTREIYTGPKAAKGADFLMSVVRVCFSFSWTLGPAIAAQALVNFGFRGLFLMAAALYLVFLAGVVIFVPHHAREPIARQEKRSGLGLSLGQPQVWLSFLAFVVVFAGNAINFMNLPLAFTRTLGGEDAQLGLVFIVGPAVEIPLMLWFGHLATRGYQLPLIKLGMVLALIYFAGLALASAPWQVYLLQGVNGAMFAILTNVAILYFQDLLPGRVGMGTAIFSNAQAAGGLLGMFSFGFIVEAIGHQHTFWVCAGLALVAVLIILSCRPATQTPPHTA